MSYLINFIRGFFMALADSVPGVSGGTIAFVLGFYDKFIGSLDNIFYGKKENKINGLRFLIKIGFGWITGMIIASMILTKLFEKHVYSVSSLFLGFVFFSIFLIIKDEFNSIKGMYKNIIFTIFGLGLVFLITFLNTSSSLSFDYNNLNIISIFYILVSAMCAISAMVLPGISGSTILLIFGLYLPVINSVSGLLSLDFSGLGIIITFIFGVILGAFLFIRFVKFSLDKYRSSTIYFILGLLIGSIYAIIMGPLSFDVPLSPINFSNFSIIFFIIGGLIIFGLDKLNIIFKKYE